MERKTTEKKRNGKVRENIKPLLLRGESEFAAAFGIVSNHTHARLRNEGMPYYCDGKMFVYDPEEVIPWLKEHWKPQMPSNL
jgi:hypothetical protein